MTKRGDRFFYTNPDQFTIKQLEEIKKQSLTSLLCVNSDEPTKMNLQPNVFRKLDSTTNALKSCSEYPSLDLSMWSGFEAPDAWDLPEPNLSMLLQGLTPSNHRPSSSELSCFLVEIMYLVIF